MANINVSTLVFFGDSLTDNGNLFRNFGQPPSPPYFNGRFSNGPTYAERVPGLLDVTAQNFAYGGARSLTGNPIPIDLNAQLAQYSAANPLGAADGTAAVIYMGNNDYLNYNPATPGAPAPAVFIGAVVGNIFTAAGSLLAQGVDKIILFTLPNITFTPLGQSLPALQLAGANAIIDGHNGALKAGAAAFAAATGADVKIVDTNAFTNEIGADAETFGFRAPLGTPVILPDGQPTGLTAFFSLDEIAFFDAVHPTAAAHGVTAAFVTASLQADKEAFLTSGNDFHWGTSGQDLVFAGAGNDTVFGGSGSDWLFGGLGQDVIFAGSGDDVASGGSGNDTIFGENGVDVLAGNVGNDTLFGGNGDDVLVTGAGRDTVFGDNGNDRIYLEFDTAAATTNAAFVQGGRGFDTSVIQIRADMAASAAFKADMDRLDASYASNRSIEFFHFSSIDLTLVDIERVEITIADVVVDTAGTQIPAITGAQAAAIAAADLWGFI